MWGERKFGNIAKIAKDFQPYIYNIWRQFKGNDPEIVRAVKKIAKKLGNLRATQRAAAKMLGVGLGTIQRDIDPNGSKEEEKPLEIKEEIVDIDPNGSSPTPLSQSGEQVARTTIKS